MSGHARERLVTARFTYQNQPCEEWPRWLWSRNWARDPDTGRLVIHRWLDRLEVLPGHTIGHLATSEIVRLDPTET